MVGVILLALEMFSKKEIFDFLSWEDEEPTLIQNILDNCEVIEDE